MKRRILTWLKRGGATVGIIAALAGSWAGYLRLSGNFHTVEKGALYRSAQLSGPQLEERIKANGIRTVINLRGNNVGQSWYDAEMQVSQAAGVQHVDLALSAIRELNDDQLTRLTALLRDAPRPILVHCEGGADRSGIASALYKLKIANRPVDEAAAQLSFRYGHFPWLSKTVAMDRTFARLVAAEEPAN